MMFSKKIISSRLRELRGSISQTEVACSVGISQQSWARYETGKVLPGAEVLHQICEKLDVSADWLLGLSDNKKSIASSGDSVSAGVAKLRSAASQVCLASDSLSAAVASLKTML